jgi:ArsR family transcriptional regulator
MEDALESDRCAHLLKAIADPERLKIIQCLRHGPLNVGEIAAKVEDEVVNVSHHLGVLRQSDFVLAEKQGRFVVYSLNPEVFTKSRGKAANRIDLGCCRIEIPEQK